MDFEKDRSDKIGYFYIQSNIDLEFQKHSHASFEFIYVNKGEIICDIDGKNFRIPEKNGALIMPGQVHSYSTESFNDIVLFIFSNDWVLEFYNDMRESFIKNPVHEFLDDSFVLALQDYGNNKYKIKSLLYYICSEIYDTSILEKNDSVDLTLANNISCYIQDHYSEDISLKELSEKLGYNYFYLSSFFNKHFKCNFSKYLNNYRVQYAREYLINSNKKMTEIASLCGFDTIRNFNRVFKAEFGVTPNQYKNLSKNNI